MVSFAKNVKYKPLGSKKVSFFALTDVVLEAEVILYNQALGYLEDDIRYLSFTPKTLIFGVNVTLVEDRVDSSPNFKQNSNLGGGGGVILLETSAPNLVSLTRPSLKILAKSQTKAFQISGFLVNSL